MSVGYAPSGAGLGSGDQLLRVGSAVRRYSARHDKLRVFRRRRLLRLPSIGRRIGARAYRAPADANYLLRRTCRYRWYVRECCVPTRTDKIR